MIDNKLIESIDSLFANCAQRMFENDINIQLFSFLTTLARENGGPKGVEYYVRPALLFELLHEQNSGSIKTLDIERNIAGTGQRADMYFEYDDKNIWIEFNAFAGKGYITQKTHDDSLKIIPQLKIEKESYKNIGIIVHLQIYEEPEKVKEYMFEKIKAAPEVFKDVEMSFIDSSTVRQIDGNIKSHEHIAIRWFYLIPSVEGSREVTE